MPPAQSQPLAVIVVVMPATGFLTATVIVVNGKPQLKAVPFGTIAY